MAERIISEETINAFCEYLVLEEKSTATVEKYLRDVRAFHLFAYQQAVTKERMMAYKKFLIEKGYAASSINSMLASLNSLLDFLGWSDCKVKKHQDPTTDLLCRGKRIDEIRISSVDGGGKGPAQVASDSGNHLWHRHSCL